MSLADGKTCSTCKFWDRTVSRGPYAACHAVPPSYDTHSPIGQWAFVTGDDWCGAHKPAPKEPTDGD